MFHLLPQGWGRCWGFDLMAFACFSLTVRATDGLGVRVTATGSPDCWPTLHGRLLAVGAESLSVPSLAHGVMAASYFFPAPSSPVCPEGFELDAFMRRLFVGLVDSPAAPAAPASRVAS